MRSRSEASAASAAPWNLSLEDFGSQRLFRMKVRGQDGRGRFRLTLRLAREDLFQLAAADPLGRSLWTLHVAGRSALLVEHRRRRACNFDGSIDLSELYLGSFPLRDLPAVLLGRVPAHPWGGDEGQLAGAQFAFVDGQRRYWSGILEGERVTEWTLKDSDGETLAELRREEGGWAVLVEHRQQLELRWREVVREPLKGELIAPSVPRDYQRGGCLDPPESAPPQTGEVAAPSPLFSVGQEGFDTLAQRL